MSVVTICQTGRVPIMAVLTCQVGNQVAHCGLQGHAGNEKLSTSKGGQLQLGLIALNQIAGGKYAAQCPDK